MAVRRDFAILFKEMDEGEEKRYSLLSMSTYAYVCMAYLHIVFEYYRGSMFDEGQNIHQYGGLWSHLIQPKETCTAFSRSWKIW